MVKMFNVVMLVVFLCTQTFDFAFDP